MTALPFRKMHGLGNDFVVLDARHRDIDLPQALRRDIADRRTGIGCDQLIVLEKGAERPFMRIYNPDGGEAEACGNATRCIAQLLMDESGGKRAEIATVAGVLIGEAAPGGLVTVDMGEPRLGWREVPLAHEADTAAVALEIAGLPAAVCCSMGNPHAAFFVEDAEAIDIERLGPLVETHPMFPRRVNAGFASLIGQDRLRLRVWERAAGPTLACGSAACAAAVAAIRLGLTGRRLRVVMERGELDIAWGADNRVRMTGPTATSFVGTLDTATLSAAGYR